MKSINRKPVKIYFTVETVAATTHFAKRKTKQVQDVVVLALSKEGWDTISISKPEWRAI